MPYTINWEKDGAYVKFVGKVSFANVLAMMEHVGADERFDRMRYLLADYSEMTEHNVSEAEVDDIAGLGYAQRLSNPHQLHAAVATDEGAIALAKHWKATVSKPENVGYFTRLEEARQWIQQRQLEMAAEVDTKFHRAAPK